MEEGDFETSCNRCGAHIYSVDRYCRQCGHLLWHSAHTQQLHDASDKFCFSCGTSLNFDEPNEDVADSGVAESFSVKTVAPVQEVPMEVQKPLFKNLWFVLTSKEAKHKHQFNKSHLRQLIEERLGNVVISDFPAAFVRDNWFVLSDSPCCTRAYLAGLANAIPCVSHLMVLDSIKKGQLLDYRNYLLPSGASRFDGHLVQWHGKGPSLLSNKRVLIYSTYLPPSQNQLDFMNVWAPIVRAMGAVLLPAPPLPKTVDEEALCAARVAAFDILLTDMSCPDWLLTRAEQIGAKVVSYEWLIEALVTGQLPDVPARFKPDYLDFFD